MRSAIRYVYLAAAFLSLGLGVAGIFLPLLPTTPLLLLAAFFFARGSERFHRWFQGTALYKKHVESFLRERAMTLRQKLTILIVADAMIAFPFFRTDLWWVRAVLIVGVAIQWYYFFFKIRTIKAPAHREASESGRPR